MTGHLCRDPNEMGSALAIVGTTGVRCHAFKQCQRLLRAAKIDCFEALEQLEALEHDALHLQRDETFRGRLWKSDVTD